MLAVGGTYGLRIVSDILKIEHVKLTKLRERHFLLFNCLSFLLRKLKKDLGFLPHSILLPLPEKAEITCCPVMTSDFPFRRWELNMPLYASVLSSVKREIIIALTSSSLLRIKGANTCKMS